MPNVPNAPDARQARLEEDFERLKQEVKDEMRHRWRQWFFHPAWTVAASALLLASIAVHFSPRAPHAQYVPPIYLREATPLKGSARDIRERERIPAPQPHAAAEILPGEATPPPPPVLLRANALRDLALPALEEQMPAAAPVEEKPAVVSEPVVLEENGTEEITPVLTPGELAALVSTPVDEEAITIIDMTDMTGMTPPQIVERPETFDENERIRSLTALAGMQIASGEIVDAWETVEMLRRYSPAAAEEMGALITEAEPEPEPEPAPVKPEPPVPSIHVYIQPVQPAAPVAVTPAPVPEPEPGPVIVSVSELAPARKERPKKRFTTDPYLRDD